MVGTAAAANVEQLRLLLRLLEIADGCVEVADERLAVLSRPARMTFIRRMMAWTSASMVAQFTVGPCVRGNGMMFPL